MTQIKIPHLAPIKFAHSIVQKEDTFADVLVQFGQIPTLAMLVEAAAQSTAAFKVDESEHAFLVSLKDIKLIQEPTKTELLAHVIDEHRLDKMRYVRFEIREDKVLIADGTLVIAVQ